MADITVFGSFVMDNVARMEKFPQEGQTVLGSTLELFPGGKGINQCVAAARLGASAKMIGMLGDDANGETFRRIMREEGIDQTNVFTCAKPTAVAQVQINGCGQNRICVIPSANHEFGFKELEMVDGALRQAKILMVQLETPLNITRAVIERAHLYGAKIIFNPAPAVPLDDELLKNVDYITPNESELEILTDIKTDTDEGVVAAAKKLLSLGVKNVIATLGCRGALLANSNVCEIIPGYRVEAVDTVAAGDSFNGALAAALAEGKTLREAVAYGNAMGALTVTKKGAIPSLHNKTQLAAFIKKQCS